MSGLYPSKQARSRQPVSTGLQRAGYVIFSTFGGQGEPMQLMIGLLAPPDHEQAGLQLPDPRAPSFVGLGHGTGIRASTEPATGTPYYGVPYEESNMTKMHMSCPVLP